MNLLKFIKIVVIVLFPLLFSLNNNPCASEVSIKWKYNTDNYFGRSSPVIGSDGTIYVGSEDNLYAINPDGTLKWKYITGDRTHSPTIGSDGTIYVGSDDYNLYAINPDGSLKWKYETERNIFSSPAIGSDCIIYVGSLDKYLYAINPDGSLKWKYETGGGIRSSPAIGCDGTIYAGSYDKYLYAFNHDGTLKWKYETGDLIISSPAIGCDGTIYVGSHDNYLHAINPEGTVKWKYETGSYIISSPAIGSDGTIYVGSLDKYLYAINPDGSLKWKYETDWEINSSPAIGYDGTIYVGSRRFYLYAINHDGILKWNYRDETGADSSPAISSEGIIYVGFHTYLYAIDTGTNAGLAESPWPMFGHNIRHTGNVRGFITNIENEQQNIVERIDEYGIKYSLTLDKYEYELDETVRLKYEITNTNCYLVGFGTMESQEYTFYVSIDDVQIYQDVFPGPEMPGGFTMTPNQTLTFVDIWNQISNSGEIISPGDYTIKAKLYAISYLALDTSGGLIINDVDTSVTLGFRIKDIVGVNNEQPTKFSLQNYPNPFNSSTLIKYQLPENTKVNLDVYNISGQKIKTLVDEVQSTGLYQVKFDANDLSSGLYFYQLKTQDTIKTNKMLLVK